MKYVFRLRKTCSTQTVKDIEWSNFTPSEVALLDRTARRSLHPRGDTVFHQDDTPAGIFCIEDGWVLLSRIDSSGNKTAFGIFCANETIGHRSFFAEEPHTATARALTDCRCYLIPTATVHRLVESNHDLSLWFLRTVASDRGPSDGLRLRGNYLSARDRMIHLLLVFRERFAQPNASGGLVFKLPIRRMEIADMLEMSPETVARTIRQLEDENLAIFSARQVIVPRPDLLEKSAQRTM